jgi:DNA-binding Lrp family transcriptional regulator
MTPAISNKAQEHDILEFTGRGTDDFWFAMIDIEVIKDKELSPLDKTVFAIICAHVNVQTRSCPLKVKTIAEEAGCSERSVQKSLKILLERGIIQRVERFVNGKQQASIYKIIGHHAPCYRGENSAPIEKSDTNRGADFAPIVEFFTPRGEKNDPPSLLEPNTYDKKEKDTPPSEGGTSSPPAASSPEGENLAEVKTASETTYPLEEAVFLSGVGNPSEVSPSNTGLFEQESPPSIRVDDLIGPGEAPSAMRETVDYFLLKTGRSGIVPKELSVLWALAEIHTPTRVNKEIGQAVERFEKSGRPLSSLTLIYIYDSLRHQNSLKHVRDKSSSPRYAENDETPDPYEGGYL